MNSWERFGHAQRGTWIPPSNPAGHAPEARVDPPPGMTSFQTSYFARHPDATPPYPPPPPPPPNPQYGYGPAYGQPYGQPYEQPYGPGYGPAYGQPYGPAYGPAHEPPRPSRSHPGYARTSDGVYIPIYNNHATWLPPEHHYGYYYAEPSSQQYPDYSQYQQPPPPPYPHPHPHPHPHPSRPSSRNTLRPFNHYPHWPPTYLPLSARINPRPPPLPINQTPISLHERPETIIFLSEAELRHRLTPIFRPMVGVVGRRVRDTLGLAEQPPVKFDMYPVQVDERGRSPAIRWRTLSRAPVYCVTLPRAGTSEAVLQDLSDSLKDALASYPNPWYRQAGYVFRVSRSAAGGERRRFWVPPLCVYKYSRSREAYRALFIEVSEERVEEVDGFHDYGDTSEDDQGALVDEMWADVRMRNAYGPWAANTQYL